MTTLEKSTVGPGLPATSDGVVVFELTSVYVVADAMLAIDALATAKTSFLTVERRTDMDPPR
jgi:hypothetical protein